MTIKRRSYGFHNVWIEYAINGNDQSLTLCHINRKKGLEYEHIATTHGYEESKKAFLKYCREAEKRANKETAQRLYNFDVFGMRDAGETPESIAKTIKQDPTSIINYLLDMVEDMSETLAIKDM